MKLSIIIPAYNEENRISNTLAETINFLKKNSSEWKGAEVIVVSDGSTDATNSKVPVQSNRYFEVKLIHYKENMGKGYALRKGILASKGDIVFFMDADGSTPVEDINKLALCIRNNNVDIAIGSRSVHDSEIKTPQPLRRRVLGQLFVSIVRSLLHLPFNDTQCGFKAFKGDIARMLFSQTSCNGFAIDIDILHIATQHGLKVKEVGITWSDHGESKVNPVYHGTEMLRFVLRTYLRNNLSKLLSPHAFAIILLVLLLLVRFATLGAMPLIDPSEARYANIGKDMAESCDYITPHIWINGENIPYWGKPPLYFWLNSTAVRLFGGNEFSARLPSFLSAVLLLAIIYLVTRKYIHKEDAIPAVLLTMSSGAFFFLGGAALLDMTLTLFVSGAFIMYYAFLRESDFARKKINSFILFAMLALGFLCKGPVAIVMFGVPVFLWTLTFNTWSSLKYHAWLSGTTIFLTIALPWFYLAEKSTPGFMKYFFINENLLRFIRHDYGDLYGSGHNYPYGMSLLFFAVSVLPWLFIVIYYAIKKIYQTGLQATLHLRHSSSKNLDYFFIFGFLGMIFFWCFARQLLIYYLLPAVPLFTIWLTGFLRRRKFHLYNINVVTMVSLIIYLTVTLFLSSYLDSIKSTKSILKEASKRILKQHNTQKIVFARHTPYSAYYYGNHTILIHPKEATKNAFNRNTAIKQDNIIIVKDRHLKKLAPQDIEDYRKIFRMGNYTAFRRTNINKQRN